MRKKGLTIIWECAKILTDRQTDRQDICLNFFAYKNIVAASMYNHV